MPINIFHRLLDINMNTSFLSCGEIYTQSRKNLKGLCMQVLQIFSNLDCFRKKAYHVFQMCKVINGQ